MGHGGEAVSWTLRPLAAGGLVSVVGESRRQDILEETLRQAEPLPPLPVVDFAEEVARQEELPWFTAALVREPDNPFDSNAIAVWSPLGPIGYLSRDDAFEYQQVMTALHLAGVDGGVCSAFLRRADNGMLGAVLALSIPRVCIDELDEWGDDEADDET